MSARRAKAAAILRASILLFQSPRAFAEEGLEQRYRAHVNTTLREQRSAVILIGAFSWIGFLFWDLLHAHSDALTRRNLTTLVVLRVGTFCLLLAVVAVSIGDRFLKDYRFALSTIVSANATCYLISILMMLCVSVEYSQRYYFYGPLLNIVFAFGLLRLPTDVVRRLMAVYFLVVAATVLGQAQFFNGDPHTSTSAAKLITIFFSFALIGVAFSSQLERSQRAEFLHVVETEIANAQLTIQREELVDANAKLNQLLVEQEARSKAIIELKEELRQRAEMQIKEKSRFIAVAVHDLKQPLQAICIALDPSVMTPAKLDQQPALYEPIGIARRAAKAMRQHINEMLEISRLESGQLQPSLDTVNITELAASEAKAYAAADSQSACILMSPSEEVCHARTDAYFVSRILRNLIDNGVKYRDKQAGASNSVWIKVGSQDGHVHLEVQDNGIGMDPGLIANGRIFEPFYQVGSSHDPDAGVGLGLSIVSSMVKILPEHRFSIDSQRGVGTRCLLTLPECVNAHAAVSATNAPEWHPDPSTFKGRFFVLVEDNDLVRASTELLLARTGALVYAVQSTSDYQSELVSIERAPDLYLIDYALTNGLTGLDVIAHIQSLHADARFLLYSGDMIAADQLAGIRRDEFIRKPFDASDLVLRIEHLLSEVVSDAPSKLV